jgi:glycerol-3-phosphate dehydrogenase (NAD(P)+)
MKKIGVLGAGTFGMSMARMLCVHGNDVQVWSALPQELDDLIATKRHPNLPGMIVPDEMRYTKDLEEVCTGKDMLLVIIPSVFLRGTAKKAAQFIPENTIVIEGAKGLEKGTNMTLSQVFEEEMGGKHIRSVVLAGPTHAEEVALDQPMCFVASSKDQEAAKAVQEAFSNDITRVYTNDDPLGVCLCGTFKNILALASGMLLGLGYGDSIRAALRTRGVMEMTHLGLKLGCKRETFMGLTGVGDTIVTAMSLNSRNCRCGKLIGEGKTLDEALKEVGQTVEGVNTLPAALELSAKYGVNVPLTQAVQDVLYNGRDPRKVLTELMTSPAGCEYDFV